MICGCGGCGGNAVQNIALSGVKTVSFLAINTDAKHLSEHVEQKLSKRLLIGKKKLGGLGAGGEPDVAAAAAEEDEEEIKKRISGMDLIILVAGEGKGTGTGATPVVARLAKELGILTIAVVTTPFKYLGTHMMNLALGGIAELKKHVDAYTVIPNENLLKLEPGTGGEDAEHKIDEKIAEITMSIVDLITVSAVQQVDINDLRKTLRDSGEVHIAFAKASGDNRITKAVDAVKHNVLHETSIYGAQRMIVSLIVPGSFSIPEQTQLVGEITKHAYPDCKIIPGKRYNNELKDEIQLFVIAADFIDDGGGRPKETPYTIDEFNAIVNKDVSNTAKKNATGLLPEAEEEAVPEIPEPPKKIQNAKPVAPEGYPDSGIVDATLHIANTAPTPDTNNLGNQPKPIHVSPDPPPLDVVEIGGGDGGWDTSNEPFDHAKDPYAASRNAMSTANYNRTGTVQPITSGVPQYSNGAANARINSGTSGGFYPNDLRGGTRNSDFDDNEEQTRVFNKNDLDAPYQQEPPAPKKRPSIARFWNGNKDN
jgi:cell division protein FtsZ